MNRRDMLRAAGAATLTLGSFPLGRAGADVGKKKRKLLVFTRSAGFEHPVVKLGKDGTCLVDRVFKKLGAAHNFDVHCTKDGRIFLPETLKQFDAIFFETTEDLTREGGDGHPPMPKEGKQALLDFVAGGKGFVGAHCASDTFHSPERGFKNQPLDKQDPYIRMLGGEFIRHGEQQKAWMRVADTSFPGLKGVTDFQLHEEWYSLKNFAPDLHVILVQDNQGMRNFDYQRPAFPATWARKHEKGRVFYTSMGHREDVWENPLFQQILLGGLSWAFGDVEADVTPNLAAAAPKADELPVDPNAGFVKLFNGKDLTGWKIHPQANGQFAEIIPVEKDGKLVGYDAMTKDQKQRDGSVKKGERVHLWRVEDGVLIGAGPSSHLFSVRDDYKDFVFRVEAMINDRGNSGQYSRTKFAGGFPPGYEAQINATGGDPIRTGSLYPDGRTKLKDHRKEITVMNTAPHKANEWFTQEVTIKGNHITIKVNGKTTLDWTDPDSTFTSGHFALQGHDPGTVVKFRKIEVKELK